MPKNRGNRKVRSKKPARNWLDLPPEVLSMILMKLNAVEILTSVQHVCSSWYKICKQPHLWRRIDMQNDGDLFDMEYSLEIMCMHAVHRSLGQVIDINIEYFGTDNLLQYIAQKSNQQLRRLRIVVCYDISDEGLTEAVSKLPLLEHLEIFLCSNIWKSKTLRTVGRCCPLLKTLKLNKQFGRGLIMVSDKEALAIAESMPKLRYLQIFGNGLTDRGLQAILDGCPDLESLDLRQCFNLSFNGFFKQKCAERIKTLHLPHDPTVGYGFITEIIDYPDYISEEYGSEDED